MDGSSNREVFGRSLLVLDGGLATELERGGADISGPLWSARLLRDDPDAIRDVHAAFFGAGAHVAITASYQASFDGFERMGIDRHDAEALMRRSVALAREAAESVGTADALVAASVGPYGAALADGSEYSGDYGLGVAELARWHLPRLQVLAETEADLLACETVPSLLEARALCSLLDDLPADAPPAWLAVTCGDDRQMRDGTPVEQVARLANRTQRIVAVGVNCTAPRHVRGLLERMSAVTDKPLVIYPNRGERWDPEARSWIGGKGLTSDALASMAADWYSAGARLIGGCCRTTPEDIAAIAGRLRRSPSAG